VNPDGLEKWRFPIPDTAGSSPAIGADGTIYMGSSDRNLYAINPNGSLKWKFFLESWHQNCPAIAPDGSVYIGAKKLIALQTGSFGYQSGAPWPAFTFSPARSVFDSSKVIEPVLHTVRGQVAMPDSTPLVEVDVSADGLMARTDEFGFYSFRLPDGEYTITIHVNSTEIPDTLPVVVNGKDVSIDLYPPVKHRVRGRLLDREGPLAGIDVLSGTLTAKTDREGRFSFLLLDGMYHLEFVAGENRFPRIRPVTVSGGDVDLGDVILNRISWRNTFPGTIYGTPCIGKDETIYFVVREDQTYRLYAVNPDSTVRGFYEIGSGMARPPVRAEDGTIYIPNWANLHAVNPDLTRKWIFTVSELGAGSPPAIASDGTLYFGCIGQVYALNPGGTVKWKQPVGDRVSTTPALGPDGSVYVPCSNGIIYAFSAGGNLKWTFDSGGAAFGTPFVGPDGALFFGSYGYTFNALNPDGTLRWKYELANATRGAPAVGNDGTLYFITQGSIMYAIGQDGVLKWNLSGVQFEWEPWVYRPTGEIWVLREGKLTALNPDGMVKWIHPSPFMTPATGSDGKIYAATNNSANPRTGYLFVIDMDEHNFGPVLVEEDRTIGSGSELPRRITFAQNHPNPFNPSTTLSFILPASMHVTLIVYDITGQKVTELVDGILPAGTHSSTWNARGYASGVYFCTLRAGQAVETRKMLLVR
jgi:outer membrane protein assembly factor BamB